jgi:DNA-binding IclR family transcriptional regulator
MTEPKRSGAQTVDRSMLLLKRLASRGRTGWGLIELAARCELDKGTAHRILAALVRGRMVVQDAETRRYRLGPMLLELSLARPDLLAMQKAFEAPLARLARHLECLTYVYLRSDTDVVVAARAGRIPIKAMLAEVGTRRPLVQTAGGAAILLELPHAEAEALAARSIREIDPAHGPARRRAVRQILEQSRSRGFGLSEGHIAPNTTAVAVAMRDPSGEPFAALNAGGPSEFFPTDRLPSVVESLREEARSIELALVRAVQAPRA